MMPKPRMLCAELIALQAVADLDQLEAGYLELVEQGDPEAMGMALWVLGAHLTETLRKLQISMVITESELLLSRKRLKQVARA